MLLHVGQRIYPDGGVHREILSRGAPGEPELKPMDDAAIDAVTRLPKAISAREMRAFSKLSAGLQGIFPAGLTCMDPKLAKDNVLQPIW